MSNKTHTIEVTSDELALIADALDSVAVNTWDAWSMAEEDAEGTAQLEDKANALDALLEKIENIENQITNQGQ